MKIKYYVLVVATICSTVSTAQNRGQAAAAGAGAALAIGAAAFQMHQLIEMWELAATEHVLATRPEENEFSVKLNRPSSGSKWSDVSGVSILSFNVNYSINKTEFNSKREVLLMFMDPGYMTEYGIDLTLVTWKYLSRDEWNNMLYLYLEGAVGFNAIENGYVYFYDKIKEKKKDDYKNVEMITNEDGETDYFARSTRYIGINRVKISNKELFYGSGESYTKILSFRKLNGDSYIRSSFSDQMDIIYNERSLGLYLKGSNRLVQLNRQVVNDIHEFLN
mgnify:CR=1 FL=1